MGRISKFLTLEERNEAGKKQKHKYSQTERAKALRREQNKRAYQRRTADKSRITGTWPNIPSALRHQAALSLPKESHFFRLEFRTREEVCDTDALAKWDFYPPYMTSDASLGTARLEWIVERVHGRRLREQHQHEARRLQRYDKLSDTEFLQEIDRDINTYLTSWHEIRRILKTLPTSSHIDLTMGESLMQWKARRVVDLLEDWKVVKKGRTDSQFICHFNNRW